MDFLKNISAVNLNKKIIIRGKMYIVLLSALFRGGFCEVYQN